MKVKIWGARGSIPSPLKPEEIKTKIVQAMLGAKDVDLSNPQAVQAYVDTLHPLMQGTAGGNTTCVEIQVGTHTIIIDAGSGIRELGIDLMNGPCGRGEGVLHLLFSHAHWDHIQGFPFFRPAFVPGNKIYIYSVHPLQDVLVDQQKFINFPVPVHYMRATREFIPIVPGEPFFIGDTKINTIKTFHPGDAYAFRFDDEYSTFVFASDAEYQNLDSSYVEPFIDFFRNADALIFDAQFTLGEALEKVDWGHSSAMIGADLARSAGVKKLILFHHDPTYSDQTLMEIQENTMGYQEQNTNMPTCEVIVAYEGLTLDLTPAGAVSVELVSNNDAAVITPSTIFDERGVGRLEVQLARLKEMDISKGSIIDFSQVETLSTSSLKALMTLRQQHGQSDIVLASPSRRIQQIIELAGFADYFAIYPSIDAAVAALQASQSLNLPGQIINDRYQIEEKLHDGRLGAALKATDLTTDQTVVLKILSPSLSEAAIGRLLRQAKQFKQFRHRHMVDVYDYGKASELSFIVEEYTPGKNLKQELLQVESPLSPQDALEVGLQITQVLEYAHSKGKIHGYLQPKNIILMEDKNDGRRYNSKIKRFGMIWLDEGVSLLETTLPPLSVHYLAPEQILGHPLDGRTDLYALGVILYEMFTGHPPFDGDDERAIMEAHLHQTPQPLRTYNPHLSNALEHFVLKLLAKNPNERYTNAQQAYHILQSVGVYKNNQTDTLIAPQRQRKMVGRQHELEQLTDFWQKTKEGQGNLIFITGETGIGKTRLVQELVRYVDTGVVLSGYCEKWDGVPAYKPFIELLQAYFATIPPEVIDQQGYSYLLSEMTRLVPEIRKLAPDLPRVSPLEPRQEQLQIMTTVTQFIAEATKVRPWLLILEDMHWIDEGSMQMLMHLARQCPTMRLMIIGTYRDTDLDIHHPLLDMLRGLSRQPGYQMIQLKRLTMPEVGQMLSYILDQSSLLSEFEDTLTNVPGEVLERIYQRTEGNPVYVEEVMNGLIDEGAITKQIDGWDFSKLAEIHLPQSVKDAVLHRIRHLHNDTQLLLRQASVLGRTFNFEDLQTMSGLSEWEVLERFDVAMERQLVHEVYGESMLSFNHAEIQQVLYEDMSPLRRRALHLQAGKAIEARTPDDPSTGLKSGRIVEQLAFHYSKAGKFEQAIIYSIEAARLAETSYANQTALNWYQRVIDMVEQLDLDKAQEFRHFALTAHESAGRLLIILGRYQEALNHYGAAQRQLVETEEEGNEASRRIADLSRKTARIYKKQGQFGAASDALDRAFSYLNLDEASIELTYTYLLRSEIYYSQGDVVKGIEWAEKGLEVAEQLPQQRQGQQATGQGYYLLASCYHVLGKLTKALELSTHSVTLYEKLTDLSGLSRSYITHSKILIDLSQWDKASEYLQKSLAIKQEMGDTFDQGRVFSSLGQIYLNRGEYLQAAELYEKSLTIWRQVGSRYSEAGVLSQITSLHLIQGNVTQVEALLQQTKQIVDETNSKKLLPIIYINWARYYLQQKSLPEAMEAINQAIEFASAQEQMMELGIAKRVCGKIEQQLNNKKIALRTIQESLTILRTIANEYEIAKTMVSLIKIAPDGQDYLDQAIEIFERIGAQADLTTAKAIKETT